MSLPFDFNEDGFQDLYVTNDLGRPNNLYINNQGNSFTNMATQYGIDTDDNDMGITMGDYNKDGFFDLFITSIDNNFLLKNNGDNTYSDVADLAGVGNSLWAWGARFSDFDLDGDEDLFVVNGFYRTRLEEPNFYYKNRIDEGIEEFEDTSEVLGINNLGVSVEANDFDFDNDGDTDIIVTNTDRSLFFYENKTINFNTTNSLKWFKVKLEGTISNFDAIGTTLTLTTNNDIIKRYYSGVGFLSQNLQPVHFGLSNATEISELKIKWPSGLEETYNNLPLNSTIKATEGQGYTDLNILPSQKIYGCTDPNSCTYNPNATSNDNSCGYLASNTIVGNTNVGFLSEESYTYNGTNLSSEFNWEIEGGEIVSGQGTDTVTVKWHVNTTASLSVTEYNQQCYSLPITLTIDLNADIPNNTSIARLWNEVLLESIRGDFARPTVHARNLFHSSVAMYDIWALYDLDAEPYLIGNTVHNFTSSVDDFTANETQQVSLNKAISYAMYRLITHRFQDSPSASETLARCDFIMDRLGYDTTQTSINYQTGDADALGNFVAQTIINYGLQDGSREVTGYDNAYYQPVNTAIALNTNSSLVIEDSNRWQPIQFETFIDQSGNLIEGNTPDFLSPEWGNVLPFALSEGDKINYTRNGDDYNVYHDPLSPPQIDLAVSNSSSNQYKWGFSMVSVWQSHLDPTDGVMWDISPSNIGNLDINTFPSNFEDYSSFYDFTGGGTIVKNGHNLNPSTQQPYQSNIVPRGDYTRVLAEFWADGPDSETPPGHWFTILNYVNDHPELEKRFQGTGDVLSSLEWDVKSYFILGGGMHDAAISAWSIKGWYDYIRPVSAIRAMAERGQSSDTSLPSYHVGGITLIDNYIEIVQQGDPQAGANNENVGQIKLYTWKGHDFIDDTETDQAGVGWILASDWYPYQRPTFVTPPFAGYVSGHSTYSRAAAELLTKITGDEFFPGGIGEFTAKANEFLVFEEGPSQDVVLQWATYRDASDQTSLSRIWGGIHPPADDIPGRFIGEQIAKNTFDFALPYFGEDSLNVNDRKLPEFYPNPSNGQIYISNTKINDTIEIFDIRGRLIKFSQNFNHINNITSIKINATNGVYFIRVNDWSSKVILKK